jgi:hypothetical protein
VLLEEVDEKRRLQKSNEPQLLQQSNAKKVIVEVLLYRWRCGPSNSLNEQSKVGWDLSMATGNWREGKGRLRCRFSRRAGDS